MNFQNQNVWIVGASSGIGEGLVRALSKQGANLIISARREARLQEIASDCDRQTSQVKVLPLDITDTNSIAGVAQTALSMFGSIDILIYSIGVSQRSLVKDTSAKVERTIMEVNYFGSIELTRAILPSMLARKSGHLVIISSVVGKFGTPLRSSYAASKHALHGYYDSLRAEVFREGISVTLVCPGYIQTEISLNSLVGDGSKYNKLDDAIQQGMPVAECSARILKGIASREEEFIVSNSKEKSGVYLKRFFPKLFSRIIRNIYPS